MRGPKQFIFLLPNMITAMGIFAGVLSMVSAIEGNFEKAAWLILLALVFDGLDGRVARMTKTTSRFGVEFDSLADIVSFGVAPALIVFLYTGQDFGRLGIVISAMYVILGAIRLARFNVMTAKTEPSVFIGVPIPTAAVFISVLVLLFEKYTALQAYGFLLLIAAILIALLMVSNIRYPSFKKVNLQTPHFMRLFVTVVFAALMVFLYPIEGFALLFTLYILYGPVLAGIHLYKRWRLISKLNK
ncbi:MAG: CDP-diacylglycerol--serine O-phosphatidyltransferase [Epsilonproteobacteria bacterium]|nr:MAG: CDP-diacylglycerol--serine O-phosphatidyltransferase [Campylobacterota bacterium]